ncbi:MAG TPA: DISARM system helicase DrmA, partial [Symbiobacteriaceae bacterium]|nr:DISARM system helicase DrmA [Symbiobacteriaceae bacterium]
MRDVAKEQVRADLVDRLRLELVGPNAVDEELGESPTHRYLCGILWPKGTPIDSTEDDSDNNAGGADETDGAPELTAPLAQSMKPSSIGLSFVVEPEHREIAVTAQWGIYTADARQEEGGGRASDRWRRQAKEMPVTLTLTPDGHRRSYPDDDKPSPKIEWLVRELQGRLAVSLFLVNRHSKPNGAEDAACLFQPVLKVTSTTPETPIFAARKLQLPEGQPLDALQDELLYRKEQVFAVGHGSAVKWDLEPGRIDRAVALQTVTIPDFTVPLVVAEKDRGGSVLDMQKLADAADEGKLFDCLSPLIYAYEDWIEERRTELDGLQGDLPHDLYRQAEEHIGWCEEARARMMAGLKILTSDPRAFAAFKFANRAMAWQRTQADWGRRARKDKSVWDTPPAPLVSTWRPFQIAFILQSILSVVEPASKERDWADLLWFPTGGGKTEAYLGLSAFLMAYRRLRGEVDGMRGDAGVTIIMRYTLRLLTIQQFQRAATLICACEMLRKEDPATWGKEPFRIGLWVGGSSTPNNFDDCEKALTTKNWTGATPVQLVTCPWCGSPLTDGDYYPHRKARRVLIGCSRRGCDFHRLKNAEGIPALVEDEEIYRLAPAMVIGTVDKFARVPWLAETGSLFGHVKGEIPGWGFAASGEDDSTMATRQAALNLQNRTEQIVDSRPLLPPELIIQDELHLISGPLGTVVGAFETAIDLLCSRDVNGLRVGPKVIASTATIRKADEQVRGLFERRAVVFPPPGLEAGRSFFAEKKDLSEASGRLYLGVFAPGRSVKTALVRVYATLLASTGAVGAKAEDLDPYYTMVGYFNSLRELGGAVRLIEDDVRSRMAKTLANPKRLGQKYRFAARTMPDTVPELTSRVDSKLIPVILDQLERTYATPPSATEPPVDVVLASNMISVGVDVPRLG